MERTIRWLARRLLIGLVLVAVPIAWTPTASAAPVDRRVEEKTLAADASVGASSFKPKTLVAKRINAKKGGTVRAKNGVFIKVPKGVMKKSGTVRIREVQDGVYDLHIYAKWSGAVSIGLPLIDGQALIAHRVGGVWKLESVKVSGGMAVAKVRSLSWFTAARTCLKALVPPTTGTAMKVALCFAKFGIRKLPEWLTKKIIKYFNDYDACKPISVTNWSIDPLELMIAACKLTETPPPPVQPPAPPPTTDPPPTSEPQPSSPPPSTLLGFVVGDAYLGGTWARFDTNDGAWYSRGNQPSNAAYWYPNGLGVGVDCARDGAAYVVRFTDGHSETWTTWFHVTDGKWMPSAAARETVDNGHWGLPNC